MDRAAKRKLKLSHDVMKAVTPVITKTELAKKLNITRSTLDSRLADGDFNFNQCQVLKQLKIIKR